MKIPVLTYHAMRIDGNDYARNDHVALKEDLLTVAALGFAVKSLSDIVARSSNGWPSSEPAEKWVGLAFDDGPDFDFYDLPHPTWGMQRSMLNIMMDGVSAKGRPERELRPSGGSEGAKPRAWGEHTSASRPANVPAFHATSFVIVSPDARRQLDRTCMIGRDWWRDEWWSKAVLTGYLAIGSHSWDHNHPTLQHGESANLANGTFTVVDNFEAAEYQIAQAASLLKEKAPNAGTSLFAYPYGESSDYLVREYFPLHGARLGIQAAFTCEPSPVTEGCNRWRLPRYVFGRDWKSSDELARILREC